MNGEFLYEAMGGISPACVDEAEVMRFPRPAWRTFASVAACLAVILVVYVGLPALLYGGSASGPELAAPAETPSVVGAPASAAETAANYLRTSPWLNLGSLFLGLAAWVLPLIALFRRQHKALPLTSFVCCALALLLQVCNVLYRVNAGDFTTLSDTMWFVMLAAVALVAGTAALNGIYYLTLRKQNLHTIIKIVLLLFFAWLILWFQLPNHSLILGSAEVYPLDGLQAVSDERAAALIEVVNASGGKQKAFSEYDQFPILEYTPRASIKQHNQHFSLVYVYDNGFSFNPFHFGEDSAHFVLIKYNNEDGAVALWKMSYEFDEAYWDWRNADS